MTWHLAVALACLALATGPMETVQARLARGDARGAAVALAGVARPDAAQAAELAAWLDAHARVAWAQGRMDEAKANALRRAASQAVTNALGSVRWVQAPSPKPAMAAR